MKYTIIQHGGNALSLVREVGREGKSAKHKGIMRDRVLVQLCNGMPVIIKGSLMLSTAEIAKHIREAIG